jgi:pyruvate formate lyase activating enzyme
MAYSLVPIPYSLSSCYSKYVRSWLLLLVQPSEAINMREAILYERLVGNSVRCHVCQWRCRIAPGHYGACKTRLNRAGTLFTMIYSEVSSVAVDPIEKKPLFHFHPGTRVYSVGTWGCSFHCRHCQNWQISYARPGDAGWTVDGEIVASRSLTPAQTVALAKREGCAGLAWTYNEPSIWLEHTLEAARLAKDAGLYTVYVTNGFMTAEALDEIGPHLDAFRVDVKGFDDRAYSGLTGIPRGRWQGILKVAERARDRWDMHVEVVTNVVPGFNDDQGQLRAIAEWIVVRLGSDTPWHLTRSFPQAELRQAQPTPLATLSRAREIGREAGLAFVYLGNVGGEEDTVCPRCGAIAIQRAGYRTRASGLDEQGRCRGCGANMNVRAR